MTFPTILSLLTDLLGSEPQLARMRAARNPYSDGLASGRIAQAVAWHFGLAGRPDDWHLRLVLNLRTAY